MDFIPFDCEPSNGNNRIQTSVEQTVGIKKKHPVDDANEVGDSLSSPLQKKVTKIYFVCRLCSATFSTCTACAYSMANAICPFIYTSIHLLQFCIVSK